MTKTYAKKVAASGKQPFTSLVVKVENASSKESSDEDSGPGRSSYSPSDVCLPESGMVSLFNTIYVGQLGSKNTRSIFYADDIHALKPYCDRCLNLQGGCVEK